MSAHPPQPPQYSQPDAIETGHRDMQLDLISLRSRMIVGSCMFGWPLGADCEVASMGRPFGRALEATPRHQWAWTPVDRPRVHVPVAVPQALTGRPRVLVRTAAREIARGVFGVGRRC